MRDATVAPVSFSATATPLPNSVRRGLAEAIEDWGGTGLPIFEVGQRTKVFEALVERVLSRLRELLSVPDSHAVLMLPGGGSHQFAMVPLNLLRGWRRAAYLCRGHWSRVAAAEARRWCEVVPVPDPTVAYVHCTSNETLEGAAFPEIPDAAGAPVVSDWSSLLFAAPIDVARFDLVYAAAQKSLGAAGLTVVLIRRGLVGHALPGTPSAFDYGTHLAAGSMLATSVPMSWVAADLMLDWIEDQGGLSGVSGAVRRKADLVYGALDASPIYATTVPAEHRSPTIVCFGLTDPVLERRFLSEAAAEGLTGLEGRAPADGLRAALYPGLPSESAERLAEFVAEFAARA
jgi:phosphoserine aminotransferase